LLKSPIVIGDTTRTNKCYFHNSLFVSYM
jgi:hypothetical protein